MKELSNYQPPRLGCKLFHSKDFPALHTLLVHNKGRGTAVQEEVE